MKDYRFKISSNLILQIYDNYLSANQIVDQLMTYPGFTLKKDNVIKSIGNLLYNNHSIKEAFYDCLTGEVLILVDDEEYKSDNYECAEI